MSHKLESQKEVLTGLHALSLTHSTRSQITQTVHNTHTHTLSHTHTLQGTCTHNRPVSDPERKLQMDPKDSQFHGERTVWESPLFRHTNKTNTGLSLPHCDVAASISVCLGFLIPIHWSRTADP